MSKHIQEVLHEEGHSIAVILDDLQKRHDVFDAKEGSKYYLVVHCFNIAQFMKTLMKYASVSYISLDHDLGDEGRETVLGSGMDAVDLIEAFKYNNGLTYLKTINVHTENCVEFDKMFKRLIDMQKHCESAAGIELSTRRWRED